MDNTTGRNINPEETHINITQGQTSNNIIEEDYGTENNADKFDLFKKRLRDEKPPNSGAFGSFIALGSILCGKFGFYSCSFLGLILTFVIPVLMIIYGALHLKDCPLNIFISIYLIVSGTLGLLDSIIKYIYQKFVNKTDANPAQNSWMDYYSRIMNCVMLFWFILGAYCVYSEYKPNTDININDGLYCDKTLYYIVFWLISMVFIFAVFFCLIGILALCCTAIIASCL